MALRLDGMPMDPEGSHALQRQAAQIRCLCAWYLDFMPPPSIEEHSGIFQSGGGSMRTKKETQVLDVTVI
ncbi:hypothetical protein CENSYa_1829 [Cenarchaeum symbiosum A]|uniref:Uncharacterized protein n=1 Tax=Cenarchaeum symbiosum (strain A) TaxID=414004 RepID=A0RYM2_CENSY|nr:hypothetical protein CENSYa_1829 [Cenarchaeum symbiosum A]